MLTAALVAIVVVVLLVGAEGIYLTRHPAPTAPAGPVQWVRLSGLFGPQPAPSTAPHTTRALTAAEVTFAKTAAQTTLRTSAVLAGQESVSTDVDTATVATKNLVPEPPKPGQPAVEPNAVEPTDIEVLEQPLAAADTDGDGTVDVGEALLSLIIDVHTERGATWNGTAVSIGYSTSTLARWRKAGRVPDAQHERVSAWLGLSKAA